MTDEDGDEKDKDERDGDERDGNEDGEDNDDDDDDEVAFTDDEVLGSLKEWARSLCRDDMRKTGLLLLEFYRKLRSRSSATTAANVVGPILSCS